MFSKRTIESLACLNKKARAKLEPFIIEAHDKVKGAGITIEVISGLRSWAAQAALYAQGRTKPGRKGGFGPDNWVTKARPGSSWHNYGLAIDLGLFKNGVYLDEKKPAEADKIYAEIGKLAASHGIEWAGNWKTFQETPHFQVTFGLNLTAARARMQAENYDVQKIV